MRTIPLAAIPCQQFDDNVAVVTDFRVPLGAYIRTLRRKHRAGSWSIRSRLHLLQDIQDRDSVSKWKLPEDKKLRYWGMGVGAGLPLNTASILSRASIPIATRVSTVALPTCGNKNVFFNSR